MKPIPAPVLVLGIGNRLLGDDAVGLVLLEALAEQYAGDGGQIEFVDGGTQGLSLLGLLDSRRGVLILDAVSLGDTPGTVHVLRGDQVTSPIRKVPTAHGSSARELLNAGLLLGQLPPQVMVVGIEPAEVRTQIGLSASVVASLGSAISLATETLSVMHSSLR